jgi:ribose transport system ATP-binding protein
VFRPTNQRHGAKSPLGPVDEVTAANQAYTEVDDVRGIRIHGISKSFAGNRVLSDFSLQVGPGEIHALVGQNGSGKSTLIKILSGYHVPDAGRVVAGGEELKFSAPAESFRLGFRFVHQDLALIPTMSVVDNFALTSGFATQLGTIRKRSVRRQSESELAALGLRLDVRKPVAALTAAQRTELAFARALRTVEGHEARLLVLDEPTAALPIDEVDQLLRTVRVVAATGVAVLYVTHHLDEIFRLADSVTVLRDGRMVQSALVTEVTRRDLVDHLVGGLAEPDMSARRSCSRQRDTVLEVRGLSTRDLRDVSFSVAKGEVVGLAGRTGSGRDVALGAIFGASARRAGTIRVNSEEVPAAQPIRSIKAGIGYLPADRKTEGGIMTMSAAANITLTDLSAFWSKWRLRRRPERTHAQRWFDGLSVRPRDGVNQPLGSFSGGNQQKILFAKWLRGEPLVLLLDDPTQGVDVGAKAEIHRHLAAAAERGSAVVLSSTDVDELVALCDRVLVFRDGAISDELADESITAKKITTRMLISGSDGPSEHG